MDEEEEANRLVDQILDLQKTLDDWRQEWTLHGGSFRLAVLSEKHYSNSSKNCKWLKVYFVSMVTRGKIVRMSLLCKINWANPGCHFWLQFFRSVDFNKVTKRRLHALFLNLSYIWAWSLPIFWGLCGQYMCTNVCQKVGTQSIKTVNLKFFVPFSGWLFWEWCILLNIWTHP